MQVLCIKKTRGFTDGLRYDIKVYDNEPYLLFAKTDNGEFGVISDDRHAIWQNDKWFKEHFVLTT